MEIYHTASKLGPMKYFLIQLMSKGDKDSDSAFFLLCSELGNTEEETGLAQPQVASCFSHQHGEVNSHESFSAKIFPEIFS